ncbi:hypothetical protein Cgig2_034061 [Carnegiea gigantea]|uniref:Uncharacterized protein n=1 Tax=Carnegiea gigantea TaxID=171969 RepID=A0A9Q1QKE2_9CARY|nr:hypothetical protein Cgig2_034061 [Carnegiea gigantea]
MEDREVRRRKDFLVRSMELAKHFIGVNIIPVLPPKLRPIIQIDTGSLAKSTQEYGVLDYIEEFKTPKFNKFSTLKLEFKKDLLKLLKKEGTNNREQPNSQANNLESQRKSLLWDEQNHRRRHPGVAGCCNRCRQTVTLPDSEEQANTEATYVSQH